MQLDRKDTTFLINMRGLARETLLRMLVIHSIVRANCDYSYWTNNQVGPTGKCIFDQQNKHYFYIAPEVCKLRYKSFILGLSDKASSSDEGLEASPKLDR